MHLTLAALALTLRHALSLALTPPMGFMYVRR